MSGIAWKLVGIVLSLVLLATIASGPPANAEPAPPPPPVVAWNAELLAYGGSVSADSFGANYNPGIFGGRFDFGIALPQRFRLQFDIEGEATGSYCTPCQSRSHLAYGGHLDWRLTPNLDFGGFAGLQNAHPTFGAPSDTNYFIGAEARYRKDWWMVGMQTGYFDVASGPGTLTDAWFLEGRAKVALGSALGSLNFNPVLGASLGYAEGSLSGTPLWASSTMWSVTLSHRIGSTPITGFVGFHQYTNKVETTGTVWDERIVKAGVKLNFWGNYVPAPSVEEAEPFPSLLRTVLTF
jgi:hypothetical protein